MPGSCAPECRSLGSTTRSGTTTSYGLKGAEERGELFLGPGLEVYEGMVVGEIGRASTRPTSATRPITTRPRLANPSSSQIP